MHVKISSHVSPVKRYIVSFPLHFAGSLGGRYFASVVCSLTQHLPLPLQIPSAHLGVTCIQTRVFTATATIVSLPEGLRFVFQRNRPGMPVVVLILIFKIFFLHSQSCKFHTNLNFVKGLLTAHGPYAFTFWFIRMVNHINKSAHAGLSSQGWSIILPGYLAVCAKIPCTFAFMFTSEIALWFGVQSSPALGMNIALAWCKVSRTSASVFSSLEQVKEQLWGCVSREGAVSVWKHWGLLPCLSFCFVVGLS